MEKGKGRDDSAPVPGPSSSRPVVDDNRSSSGDTSFRLNCLIEGDRFVFAVTVSKYSKITALKKLVHGKGINVARDAILAKDLVLLKVNIDLETSDEDSLPKLAFTKDDEGVQRLKEWDFVSDYWTEQPENGKVHIFVKVPATAIGRKRGPEEFLDNEGTGKRPRYTGEADLLPSEADISALYTRLQKLPENPDWYSDPGNNDPLPFPFLYDHLPVDRFLLHGPDNYFEYMGRERFSDLWKTVESMKVVVGFTMLYIHGTMGHGKSHILAALACLSSRRGRHTVYIPDCRQMLVNPLAYIQSALLCAFTEPSESTIREQIRYLRSEDEVLDFCGSQRGLYFIVDEINALEPELVNKDNVTNADKEALSKFLQILYLGHYTITSSSANYGTAMHMRRKQTGDLKISMMGGMSSAEVKAWWRHNRKEVPKFEDYADKTRVEELTGCIPLLLRPLLKWGGKDYRAVELDIWEDEDYKDVEKNIRTFANKMKADSEYESYIAALFRCLTHSGVKDVSVNLFDYRYFYPNDMQRGDCTCGLARRVAELLVRENKPDKFLSVEWWGSIAFFKNKRAIVGSMVEQACLSAISRFGLDGATLSFKTTDCRVFLGNCLPELPLVDVDCSTLYIPDNPRCKNIDALYLKVQNDAKTVLVAPIQITLNPLHKDSEANFYCSEWRKLQDHYEGYKLSTTFVWIVEDTNLWKEVEERLRETRTRSHVVMPRHDHLAISIGNVFTNLGQVLARCRVQPATPRAQSKFSGAGEDGGSATDEALQGESSGGRAHSGKAEQRGSGSNRGRGSNRGSGSKNLGRKVKGGPAAQIEVQLRRSARNK